MIAEASTAFYAGLNLHTSSVFRGILQFACMLAVWLVRRTTCRMGTLLMRR